MLILRATERSAVFSAIRPGHKKQSMSDSWHDESTQSRKLHIISATRNDPDFKKRKVEANKRSRKPERLVRE
jgi:hypothetical protein